MSAQPSVEYDPKNMRFRRLGNSGLRVPVLSLGGWLTYGGTVNGDPVKDIIKTAFDHGINMFDTAEEYSGGQSEIEMGKAIKSLGLRRTDLVVSTKIFWGIGRKGPNDAGLSRKHIIEGLKESLERLQLDYVDIVFAHRADINTPMEEVVRAFNFVIDKGWALYWATSEWSAQQVEEAIQIADRLGLVGPIADQCKYSMLHRRPEKEYSHLFKKYHYGTTVFSPLEQGILTGKYNNGIPPEARLAYNQQFGHLVRGEAGEAKIGKVRELTKIAERLGCTMAQLALAWVLRNPNTSTMIIGASRPEQIVENIKALDVVEKLTPEVLKEIEGILENQPEAHPTYGRMALDPFGRV